MDCSPPGSFVHGISQVRLLEWIAISFSRGIPDPGIEPESPALQADSLPPEPPGKPRIEKKLSHGHLLSDRVGVLRECSIILGQEHRKLEIRNHEFKMRPTIFFFLTSHFTLATFSCRDQVQRW